MVINWTEKSAFIDGCCGHVTGKDGCVGARRSQGKSLFTDFDTCKLWFFRISCDPVLDRFVFFSDSDFFFFEAFCMFAIVITSQMIHCC